MSLLKEISEDIQAYKDSLEVLVESIQNFEDEIRIEKRLGIMCEAEDYYTNGNAQQSTPRVTSNTIDFVPSQDPIEKPVQHPNAGNTPQRIHLIYDPMRGKVVNVMKTDMRGRPPAEYAEANAAQVADAMKHIESFSPQIAEKLKSGTMNVWIPRSQAQTPQSNVLSAHSASNPGGTNTAQMDPSSLARAQQAAGHMSLAK